MKHDNSNQNPWAGLSSYEDPAKSELKLKFCGRDNETKEVMRLIDDNFFVTLYGKSGIGKTSLLNAGVFPVLRREQYTPLSLRLGMSDEAQTYQDIITAAIEHAIEESGGSVQTINVVDEQTDRSAIDYLWNWFARHYFLRANGQATFPVIVFDQFEEVFRHQESLQKTEVLLTQLHFLIDESHALNDCIVNGEQYYYDFNFRFVLSIREDDLYRLEDSIDNCALTALKRCRYRLRSLSEQSAEAVILVPGEGFIKEDEQKGIVDTIIGIARNKEDKSISTNVLSLICNSIFVDFQKSGADHITPSLVDTFIKGNPFERFYNEATHGFSNREKSYIEDNLVDSTGRRNSISESDFLNHVNNGEKLINGGNRILQRVSISSDSGNSRIELIHDSFCEPLIELQNKRIMKKKILSAALFILFFIFCIGIGTFIYYQNKKNWELKKVESRFIAAQSEKLTNGGDSYLASLLGIRALPIDLSNPDRPFIIEAEAALRHSLAQKNAIIYLEGKIMPKYVAFSSNGKKIIVAAPLQNSVLTWDAESGASIPTSEDDVNIVYSHLLSPNGNAFIVDSWPANTICIKDSKTGHKLCWEAHASGILSTSFSPDGKKIISSSWDKTIRIWDTKGKLLHILKGHENGVNFASFSSDGKKVVSASSDNTVKIWDVETERCLHTLLGHSSDVNYALFSPDGKMVISSSSDHTIRIWDTDMGICLRVLKGHKGGVSSAVFSSDGKRVASVSYDRTIRLWDLEKNYIGINIKRPDIINYAIFSQNGDVVSASEDNIIRMWNYKNGKFTHVLKGHKDIVNQMIFSPDKNYLASASHDKTIRIWDIHTGQEIQSLIGHAGSVNSIAFSPDGKRVASASSDHMICIWDIASGKK